MKWKKVIDQPELKIYESEINGKKIIIEARLEDEMWHIIKKDDEDVMEFKVNLNDLNEVLESLLHKKTNKSKIKKQVNIKLFRTFKDNLSEKWIISINKESYSNFAFVHINPDLITVDVILFYKYKKYEDIILNELKITLGLNDDDIEYNVYYYTHSNKYFDLTDYEIEPEEE